VAVDVTQFGLREMLKCSLDVRECGRSEPSMESAGRKICRYFYNELVSSDGGRACALVRMYKVHPFGGLPPELQRFARRALRSADGPSIAETDTMRCLALLATVGDEEAWNHRHLSHAHQAIPLPSAQIVSRAPMIAQLIRQFGLDLDDVIRPSPDLLRNTEGKTYGVFHVEEAADSPYIPAQAQFVERYGIRSVLGFGGSLPGADLFAVILFARAHIPPDAADRFRTIALDAKGVLLPHASNGTVFDTPKAPVR